MPINGRILEFGTWAYVNPILAERENREYMNVFYDKSRFSAHVRSK